MIKRNTAPERDRIDYHMIKKLPEKLKETLLRIYNAIWQHGFIPKDWRQCCNIPRYSI